MTKYSNVGLSLLALTFVTAACGSDDRAKRDDAGLADLDTGDDDGADADAGESTTGDDDADADDAGDDSTGEPPPPANDDDGPAPTCDQAMFSVTVEPGTPQVMLLLDKSRSMVNFWDHDGDPATPTISRWHSLHNVVSALTHQFADTIDFGAQLFPSADAWLDEPTNAMSCNVADDPEVPIAKHSAEAIIAALPGPTDLTISGGTPATSAVESAMNHLMELPGKAPRAIILLTDGAANCNADELPEDTLFVYDAALPVTVQQVYGNMSIPVYVVGINILDEMGTKPAVNAYEALSEVAIAGGVPSNGPDSFYNAFNEIELIDALQVVAGQIECTLPLQQEPEHPDLVEVTIAGATYSEVADCETENGFVYTSPAGPFNSVRLCGSACEALQGDGGTVAIDYLCP